MKTRLSLSIVCLTILAALLSCQFANNVLYPPTPRPTRTPNLPVATSTPSTPQPTPERTATAQAAATLENSIALQTAIPDLIKLGLDPDEGELVYYGFKEVKLISQGGGYLYPLDEDLIVHDFILGVDISWDSESGYAGCGIFFHADKDFDRGQQGRFHTVRFSTTPAWDVELVKFGYYYGTLSGTLHFTSLINRESDSTNHYVLVSRGSTLTVFANGQRLGTATLTDQLFKGQFAFFSFTDTGIVSCNFHNFWVIELPSD